ncbi:MAG: DNRLRE domain-containing protein [Candidatus Hydrogenedens sp.]|nr:DNRLRE domain-containing protein [Candidatus Hydrogenedens sp.]
MPSRVGTFAVVAFGICLLLVAAPAPALDAGLETILGKIQRLDSTIDPLTHDADMNGLVDKAEVRLLDRVLQLEEAPQHALILGVYLLNRIQVGEDNTLTSQCTLLSVLYKFTCDELEKFIAGGLTIGEETYVTGLLEQAAEFGLELDTNDYDLTMNQYLGAQGDLDGDGFTNVEEFESVCGQFDQYVEAAMDPELTPDTVPCCGVCPLTITQQPAGGRKYTGQQHAFFTEVTDTEGEVLYQWFKDGAMLPGATSDLLELNPLVLSDEGTYWCIITDDSESVTTEEAVLQVAERVAITKDPESVTKLAGDSHQFTVEATGGLGRLRYQWEVNGSPIGGDAPTLTLGDLETSDAGSYLAVVSDGIESKTSAAATLEVLPRLEIDMQPEGLKAYAGGSHTLRVGARNGLGDYRFTWYRSGSIVATGSAEVVLNPVAASDSGNWFCRVQDDFDTRDSSIAKLTIANPVAINQQPISGTYLVGTPLVLSVAASGGFETLAYQWLKGGQPVSRGRQANLTFDALTLNNAGSYTCEVTDGTTALTSEPAVIVVEEIVVVEGEGEGEGLPEGVVEGTKEGEGQPEGVLEGSAEGEGATDGEGAFEGSLEGTADGEGSREGSVEGTSEGEGQPEGVVEGTAEGEGSVDGDGAPDGEGSVEGVAEGEGAPEGMIEGEGGADGEGTAEGEGAIEGEGEPELLEIPASLDTTLYEDSAGSIGNGAGQHLFVGRSGEGLDRRALLFFNVADALPGNAEVLSARLKFTVSRGDRSAFITVHQVTREWGEGPSDAPGNEGQGAPAPSGDATWIHSIYDTAFWATAGGDFVSSAVASVTAPGLGSYAIGGKPLGALVGAWLDGTAENHGLLLAAPESGDGGALRLDSRENATEANRPVLEVRYTAAAEEGEGAVDGEGAADGEGTTEGMIEGGGEMDGEGTIEGTMDGEGQREGEGQAEGSVEGTTEGEGQTEGVVEGEGNADGEGEGEGESIPLGEAVVTLIENLGDYDLDDDLNLNFIDIEALKPDITQEEFDSLDLNADGFVSLYELREFAGLPNGVLALPDAPEGGYDFGSRLINVMATRTITLTNAGDGPLSLRLRVSNGEHFKVDSPLDVVLSAGGSTTRTITFVPLATGLLTDQLIVSTRDGEPAVRVDLTGTGTSTQVQGCLADPNGPGGVDLQSLFTVGIGLLVLAISFLRSSTRGN